MKNQLSILSLDLGGSLGWARNIITLKPDVTINVADHGTIYLDDLATDRMKKDHNEVLNRHRVRIMIFEEAIRKLINVVKFDGYVVEDVFMMPQRVGAFRSLAIYMDVLERIINFEKQKQLHALPPTIIKQLMTKNGLSDKLEVQQAILSNRSITVKNPNSMTSHESDAIACCFAYVHGYLLAPL